MLIVTGHLTIDPERREEAEAAVRACVTATRQEAGNEDYRFSWDLDEPGRLNLVEQWADEEAMQAHMGTPHLAEMMTAIGPCIAGSVEVVRHDVTASKPLF